MFTPQEIRTHLARIEQEERERGIGIDEDGDRVGHVRRSLYDMIRSKRARVRVAFFDLQRRVCDIEVVLQLFGGIA